MLDSAEFLQSEIPLDWYFPPNSKKEGNGHTLAVSTYLSEPNVTITYKIGDAPIILVDDLSTQNGPELIYYPVTPNRTGYFLLTPKDIQLSRDGKSVGLVESEAAKKPLILIQPAHSDSTNFPYLLSSSTYFPLVNTILGVTPRDEHSFFVLLHEFGHTQNPHPGTGKDSENFAWDWTEKTVLRLSAQNVVTPHPDSLRRVKKYYLECGHNFSPK